MEEYINATKTLLAILQETLTEEEFNKSAEAGEKMYDKIRQTSEEFGLSIREMLNATLSIHMTILEVIAEQMDEARDEE